MDNYRILNIISINFHKLFTECINGNIFIPPLFITSKDIDALIVLNQIADIISKPDSVILNQTLSRIIFIKCKEFTELYFSSNPESFRQSFLSYIDTFKLKYDKIDNMVID